jgi:LysR family transcriptional regulator, low CO2-responsive transcriptional regulator
MEFRNIEAFLSVAERASFTQAGDQMHLTQSAVSQLIRRLEEELGEPLFVRNGRAVHLTRTGADLLPVAAEAMKWLRKLSAKSAPRPEEITGGLRVGTAAAATSYLWADTYRAFTQTYPNVQLDVLTTQQTEKTTENLLNAELDVGIIPFPIPSSRLTGTILGHHEALLVAAPSHPLARKRKVTLDDLGAARFILYQRRMNFRALAERYFAENAIDPPVILQTNDTNLVRSMVEAGCGLAFLPDWGIQRELAEGRLIALPHPGPRLREEFGIVYLTRGICTAAQEFVKFCLEHNDLLPAVARGGFHGRPPAAAKKSRM